MADYSLLNSINFGGGINPSAPPLSDGSKASLSDGSWNSIVAGDGYTRGCSGFGSQGANSGSRKMLPFGKTWGGIKDTGAQGSGSFFEDIGRSRWGIGAGQPNIEGADVAGFVLSTLLQVSVASGGIFAAPVQAGLAQPSAPDVGIIDTVGDVTNPISIKIERRRPSTGARSLASPTSAVIVPAANRVRVTFPSASAGQTHWRVYSTFQGFGGTGIHYLAPYNINITDIPESTVVAGTVDGIDRSLEFNYKDGDLIPVEASYDDYTPPAATHAIRLENVLNLAGCYNDSTVSSTNSGTAIAVSKVNNYESYVPTSLLFLPEQIVDALARPVDDFGYIACANSIHAIQFVGYRGDELPPCTITTVLPEIGISFPHNWTTVRGRLLLYSAEGTLLLMDKDGSFDTSFAGPVTKIIKDWAQSTTIVGYDPKNELIMVANGKTILIYSLIVGQWRQVWLPDFGIPGSVFSCTTSKRRLYITVNNGGSLTAYSFDDNTTVPPVSFVCNYQDGPTAAAVKDIYELAMTAETGVTTVAVMCVSKNLLKNVYRRLSATNASNVVTDAESSFTSRINGKKIALFGNAIASGGAGYLIGRAVYVNASTINIVDNNGSPVNAAATLSELLMFAGEYVAARSIFGDSRHFANYFPNIAEAKSYAVAVWMQSSSKSGNVLGCEVMGSQYASSRALV